MKSYSSHIQNPGASLGENHPNFAVRGWGQILKPPPVEVLFPPPARRQLFPLEIKSWWKNLPPTTRLFIICAVGAHIIIALIWAYYRWWVGQ